MRRRLNRWFLCLIDIGIFAAAFLIAAWIKPATVRIYIPNYWGPMVIFAIIWILVSLAGHKYTVFKERRYSSILSSILSSAFISTSLITILIFSLKQLDYSRLIVFGTLGFATSIELFVSWAYYYSRKFIFQDPDFATSRLMTHSKVLEDGELDKKSEYTLINDLMYHPPFSNSFEHEEPITQNLKNRCLVKDVLFFEFIKSSIDLDSFVRDKSEILDTATLFNIQRYDRSSKELLLNLHPVNDFRHINKYFIEVNRVIKNGAVFISCGQTLEDRRQKIKQKYLKVLAYPVLLLDFIFNRVFPKLDILKGIYFSITKGKNRPISRCEILGRLSYCGFNVIATKKIDNHLYFIAVKEKGPSTNPNPSYGPIFKMQRVGKGGNMIGVYKVRTMHPYSEYLQGYVLSFNGYADNGKPENDFRITGWGKVFRKYWLDEIPQLFNLLKGEMSLVGVRPVSERFLREYPSDLKEMRLKYKPGCIPPYVALKMQSVEEYLESERIYLTQKEKHPFITDIRFFFKAVYNILTRKIVSG